MALRERVSRSSSSSPSRFDVETMETMSIRPRTLNQYSVHFSPQSQSWVATITRNYDGSRPGDAKRCVHFCFRTEKDAKRFARAYTPPKMLPVTRACQVCKIPFNNRSRPSSCRNCGVCICDRCSARWATAMLPRTFITSPHSLTVRVCKNCDWLSNAFCMSLLHGKLEAAQRLHQTGNLNLRNCFADINGEGKFRLLSSSLVLLKILAYAFLIVISMAKRCKCTSDEQFLLLKTLLTLL